MNTAMEQALAPTLAKEQGGEPNPVDIAGLCLLSLDGGGVRGLSMLYILKGLIAQLNQARQAVDLPSVKPCEIFDLIGGTSTGGYVEHSLISGGSI
jgi:patatin-like phospholipase/acyl hydrolase